MSYPVADCEIQMLELPRRKEPMSKHTPGPWRILNLSNFPSLVTIAGPQGVELRFEAFAKSEPIEMANAHLIAAAPEMLEALKQCRQLIYNESLAENQPSYHAMLERVSSVIAKAEGK